MSVGMLYYTPQIWCSDNTDAVDRTKIQYGTSFGYPLSVLGSHVSAVPNHQTGRITSMETRGIVAMTGAFGYELDLNQIGEADQEQVKAQIKKYYEIAPLLICGDYYRLSNPFEEMFSAWMVVDAKKETALVSVVKLEIHGNMPLSYVRLQGLNPEYTYREAETGRTYSGNALMELGIPVSMWYGEYQACQWKFEKCEA